jgi:Icc protein
VLNILQITDVHLRSSAGQRLLGVDTDDSLRAVLTQAFAERKPDAVLVTGDVAHDAQVQTYERFISILDAFYDGPRLLLPGNHDLWAPMQRFLSEPSVLSLPGWDLIGLDSHVDDSTGGEVAEPEMLALREACAAATDKHILLATHHPPITLDCPWIDAHRIQNGTELLAWLSEHTTVRAMVFGHAHQIVESVFESRLENRRIALLGTPSTCFQFEPRSVKFTIDDRKPGYRWLFLGSDGGVTSEVHRVADYPLKIELPQRR